ncbi:MAG: ATP-binding protein involved in chromosome partitioning [Candidatus Poriferisodalaceae bacterium]|jgi:ATP-binding protein involved in chromosome partitioning|tara:strand:+ start:1984 stop:3165 length:1182 start_codon:yes stop_codon:yes gene_type:complete
MSKTQVDDDVIIGLLRGVIDPELHDNIVDLGMVRSAYRENSTAHITIALTTAGCPLRATIKRDCETRVKSLPGIEKVKLHWDELNAKEKARVMERARKYARDNASPTEIQPTTRVLSIASGKGGVGKSSVTVNIAASLANRGFTVGVLDADIWGFSVPRMLGLDSRLEAKIIDSDSTRPKIIPEERSEGSGVLKVVSTGLMVDTEDTALMWRGLMLAKAVEQFLRDVQWGYLDYLLIDMPPGTGDVQMALARLLPQAEMIVVTTPSLSAQKVAVRVADMARRSHMPILGVIENMSAFVTPDGTSWPVFGEGGGVRLATEIDVPLLGSIPLEPSVSAGGDNGTPVSTSNTGAAATAFNQIVERLVSDIAPPLDLSSCSAHTISEVSVSVGNPRK